MKKTIYHDKDILFRHVRDEEPDQGFFKLHIHELVELYYFVEGQANFIIESKPYPIVPDTFVLIRPLESHTIRLNTQVPYERYTLNFPLDLLDVIDPDHHLIAPFYNRTLGEKNIYKANEFDLSPKVFFEAMEDPELYPDNRQRIIINLSSMLCQVNKAFHRKTDHDALEETLVSRIISYINMHLFDDLDVAKIADAFYISVSKLNRLFKQGTSSSVWQYVLGKRLVACRQRILDGVPATHAYTECGFNDYPSFYRMYVKQFGVSPKNDCIRFK